MVALAQVSFTPNIQRHVTCPAVDVPGRTVRELLDEVFRANPQARGYVVDEQGALRRHMAIFLNGKQIADRTGLSDSVPEGAELFVMQALSGG